MVWSKENCVQISKPEFKVYKWDFSAEKSKCTIQQYFIYDSVSLFLTHFLFTSRSRTPMAKLASRKLPYRIRSRPEQDLFWVQFVCLVLRTIYEIFGHLAEFGGSSSSCPSPGTLMCSKKRSETKKHRNPHQYVISNYLMHDTYFHHILLLT